MGRFHSQKSLSRIQARLTCCLTSAGTKSIHVEREGGHINSPKQLENITNAVIGHNEKFDM